MENPFEIIHLKLSDIETAVVTLVNEVKWLKLQESGKFISAKEVCRLFNPKISLPTVKNWTDKGYLTRYIIGNRVWYKKDEVMGSVKTIKKYNPK